MEIECQAIVDSPVAPGGLLQGAERLPGVVCRLPENPEHPSSIATPVEAAVQTGQVPRRLLVPGAKAKRLLVRSQRLLQELVVDILHLTAHHGVHLPFQGPCQAPLGIRILADRGSHLAELGLGLGPPLLFEKRPAALERGPDHLVGKPIGQLPASQGFLDHVQHLLSQMIAGPVEPLVHRLRRQVQERGDFLLGQALQVEQGDQLLLLLAEGSQSGEHRAPALGRDRRLLRRFCGRYQGFLDRLGQRLGSPPVPHAALVDGDLPEPGSEAVAGLEVSQLQEGLDERLLSCILGRIEVPRAAQAEAENRVAVALHQAGKSLDVSAETGLDQIPVVRRRHVGFPELLSKMREQQGT